MKVVSCDIIFLSHDKSFDLTGILLCRATLFKHLRHNRATLFKRLRHNLLSLRQFPVMLRHKPDLLLFRSIVGTGDLLSKHALGIL